MDANRKTCQGCWTCRALLDQKPLCPSCGAVQPPNPEEDFFHVFGLDHLFDVDATVLEQVYQERQRQLHPDRFAGRPETERRFSVEQAAQINAAYQTLRSPFTRAAYLLKLAGRPASGDGGSIKDPAFLMEIMELREELDAIDPHSRGAEERLRRMRKAMEDRMSGEISAIGAAFRDYFAEGDPQRLNDAGKRVERLNYYRRYLEELDRKEEELY
ncbi:MAG: Fe-S protein assembly co-chaperone HscB [Magnetococcales bacterium]|nr:Fe-S protein assembly co-chaperone HscB [Magnetococcales bacterium]